MFQVRIDTVKGMHVGNFYITDKVCIIGKKSGNGIVLHGWRISSEHASLKATDEGIFIEDLGSKIGTRVNGNDVKRYGPLAADDVVQIHDYSLSIMDRSGVKSSQSSSKIHDVSGHEGGANADNEGSAQLQEAQPQATNGSDQTGNQSLGSGDEPGVSINGSEPHAPPPPAQVRQDAPALDHSIQANKKNIAFLKDMHEWRVTLRKMLHTQMDLRRINVSSMDESELRELTHSLTSQAISDLGEKIPDHLELDQLREQVVAEAVGLGPLEPLLAREDISEIMVNSSSEVFYETQGRIYKSDVSFTDNQAVQATIERIVTPVGRRIDESSPMVDARLKDGSRVNAIIPPLALKGPCLTIRKFMNKRLGGDDLVNFGSVNDSMIEFLKIAVEYKKNILVSGGTGSGKTTLLNVLSNYIPDTERIVTIEDSAELQLYQPNLVPLESRPENQEGRGGVSIRDLVRNSLRMRPDRIVVGECRGGETLDMLQAMNTGHDGSLTTAHANSPRDCISRLEVMVMMAGMDLPAIAIREQVASAIDLIVQQTRFSCGSRKVTSISEVVGVENGRIQLAEIFRFVASGYDENTKVAGQFSSTGLVPEFYEDLQNRGVSLDMSVFQTEERTA